jgi:thiol:disulfide interchange protein DsbD
MPGWRRCPILPITAGLAAAILVMARGPAARGAASAQVKARLLADSSAVQPGRTFALGVLLEIERGWHVYWKYPGDAGLATSVVLKLPPPLAAGPLRWPVPARFTQPGDVAGFGYADSVLLTVRVEVPAAAFGGSPPPEVVLAADVAWLACKDVCVPGAASVQVRLPVAKTASPANERLFAEWEKRLPVPLGDPACPASVEVRGGIPFGGDTGRLRLEVAWRRAPVTVDWFAAPPDALAIEDVAVRTVGLKSEIAFTARVRKGVPPPALVLDSVIAHADARGDPRGIAALVPLAAPPLKPEPAPGPPAPAACPGEGGGR